MKRSVLLASSAPCPAPAPQLSALSSGSLCLSLVLVSLLRTVLYLAPGGTLPGGCGSTEGCSVPWEWCRVSVAPSFRSGTTSSSSLAGLGCRHKVMWHCFEVPLCCFCEGSEGSCVLEPGSEICLLLSGAWRGFAWVKEKGVTASTVLPQLLEKEEGKQE